MYLYVCTIVVVRSSVTSPDSSRFFYWTSTPKYHDADKHDTPPSHFKLTLGQPALLKILIGER